MSYYELKRSLKGLHRVYIYVGIHNKHSKIPNQIPCWKSMHAQCNSFLDDFDWHKVHKVQPFDYTNNLWHLYISLSVSLSLAHSIYIYIHIYISIYIYIYISILHQLESYNISRSIHQDMCNFHLHQIVSECSCPNNRGLLCHIILLKTYPIPNISYPYTVGSHYMPVLHDRFVMG